MKHSLLLKITRPEFRLVLLLAIISVSLSIFQLWGEYTYTSENGVHHNYYIAVSFFDQEPAQLYQPSFYWLLTGLLILASVSLLLRNYGGLVLSFTLNAVSLFLVLLFALGEDSIAQKLFHQTGQPGWQSRGLLFTLLLVLLVETVIFFRPGINSNSLM